MQCVLDGITDGLTRMEVEFPPVPTKLDGEHRLQRPPMLAICLRLCTICTLRVAPGYKGASDLFIDSNVQLALAAARKVSWGSYAAHGSSQLPVPVKAHQCPLCLAVLAVTSWQMQGAVCTL